MKSINLLFGLVAMLLILVVFVFGASFFNKSNIVDESKRTGFCGTEIKFSRSIHDERGVDHYLIGKELFKINCAQCHHKNMKDDMAGPSLGGSINRWKGDTLRMANYLRNPELYLKETADKKLKDMHLKFGKSNKPGYPEFTMSDVKSIIEYIKVAQGK